MSHGAREALAPLGQPVWRSRAAGFVGRQAERTLVRHLAADPTERALVQVWGAPGIGKSALLRQLAIDLAADGGCRVLLLAGEPLRTPGASDEVEGIVRAALATPHRRERPGVLLLDRPSAVDLARHLEHERGGPHCSVVVMTADIEPRGALEMEPLPGLSFHLIGLGALAPDDARLLVEASGAPATQLEAILDISHGHPLCLVLAIEHARRHPEHDFARDGMPPTLAAWLLERATAGIDRADRRSALEACAVAGRLGEDVLRAALRTADGFELFQWLRRSALIESTPLGLALRQPFRAATLSELHWRDPDAARRLLRRIDRFYRDRLRGGAGADAGRLHAAYRYVARPPDTGVALERGPGPEPEPEPDRAERSAWRLPPAVVPGAAVGGGLGAVVRDALRAFGNDAALAQSPLMRTRLVPVELSVAERVRELRSVLRSAAEPLRNGARTAKLHRALERTYFERAATQEQAADSLGLPFGTYRRHLRGGLEHVTASLARSLRTQAAPGPTSTGCSAEEDR